MNKMIDEISAIVTKYGEDIVTEGRFVHILKDLYPDRDNQKKFNILSELISQGTVANLLNCKKSNIKSFVEKHSAKLSKKQGFDKADISQILYAIAVGTNNISRSEYYSFVHQPKQQNPQPTQRQYDFKVLDILALIWSFLGLIATPFIYLGLLASRWWPFWALTVSAVANCFTFVPGTMAILGEDPSKKVNTFLAGAISLIGVCLSLFLAFGPFFIHWTSGVLDLQYNYWFGPSYHIEYHWAASDTYEPGFEPPTLLTFLIGLFYGGIALSFLNITKDVADIYKKGKNVFIKGVLSVVISLTVVSLICFIVPYIAKLNFENKIKAENEQYLEELRKVEDLKNSRASTSKEMSFKDFFFGQDFEQCNAIINDTPIYTTNHYFSSDNALLVDSINYTSVIDTTLCATTEWDNIKTDVCLFFNNNKLIGISLSLNHELDSLVSMYSKKYGTAEHIPTRKGNCRESEVSFEDSFNDTYSWTYKNGIIQIRKKYYHDCIIIYIDRLAETLLKNLRAKEETERLRQIKEAEDAKRKAQEEERKKAEEERIRKQDNHKQSINQI